MTLKQEAAKLEKLNMKSIRQIYITKSLNQAIDYALKYGCNTHAQFLAMGITDFGY